MKHIPVKNQRQILQGVLRLLNEEREALKNLEVSKIDEIHTLKLSLLEEIQGIQWDLTDQEISQLRDEALYLQTHNRQLAVRLAEMLQGLWKSLNSMEGTYTSKGTVTTEGGSLLGSKWG